MLSSLKVVFGLCLAIAVGIGLAFGFDWIALRLKDRFAFEASSLTQPSSNNASFATKDSNIQILDIDDHGEAAQSASIIEDFISETDPERRLWQLRQNLQSASVEELEDLFIEAMSYDLEDRLALQVAGIALKGIAQHNASLSVGLLYTLSPAEKEKLVWSVASGWALDDADSAWDWISTAWVDPEGNFIDRQLQNRLFREAIDSLLQEKKAYQIAAGLVSSIVDPDLRTGLADLIAFRAVRDNPSEALSRIDFDSNDYLDTAIMDAIIDEWAQRDSIGAKDWTLDNEQQVSTKGARYIAKNLLLNEADHALRAFHGDLSSIVKKDSVAAEATRLLARRDPIGSVDWLHVIHSSATKREATYDALYEIGHDSFESTITYVDLAYDLEAPERASTLYAALESWTRVDQKLVSDYLDSGKSGMPQVSVNAMKDSLGL